MDTSDAKSVSSHPARPPGLITRSPVQLERTVKIKEMLTLTKENSTPRFTTEEIVTKISEWDCTWSEEYRRKGLNEKQTYMRKIIAVQRVCQQLRAQGIPAGFLDRRPGGLAYRKQKPKIITTQFTKMEVSKIVQWFKNPENCIKLSWVDREHIMAGMAAVKPAGFTEATTPKEENEEQIEEQDENQE